MYVFIYLCAHHSLGLHVVLRGHGSFLSLRTAFSQTQFSGAGSRYLYLPGHLAGPKLGSFCIQLVTSLLMEDPGTSSAEAVAHSWAMVSLSSWQAAGATLHPNRHR